MKIYNQFITNQYQYKQSFKSNDNEWHIFGIDEAGQPKRDYIRQWHDDHYIPYQSIYENEGRMSEYQLKHLLNNFFKKTIPVDGNLLYDLDLENFESVSNNIFRGCMINNNEIEKLKLLKDAGIRSIIDLEGYNKVSEECKKIGLNYFNFYMDANDEALTSIQAKERESRKFWRYIVNLKDEKEIEISVQRDINLFKENQRNSITRLTDFIQIMQEGNVYIGCQMCTDRTDTALMFDYLFNPKAEHPCYMGYVPKAYYGRLENLYNILTDCDKLKMGWTKAFDKEFLQKLKELKFR